MAEELLDTQGGIEISEEFKRNARRFMYYQFFRVSLRFDEFLEAHRRPGYVLFRPFSWRNLTRERSKTMSVLLDGILHGNRSPYRRVTLDRTDPDIARLSLSQERARVEQLKHLAKSLRLEFGWHYLLDLVWISARWR
jgi:hypothetical protein